MIKPKNLTEIEKAEILQSMKILGGNYLLEEVEKLRAYFLYVDIDEDDNPYQLKSKYGSSVNLLETMLIKLLKDIEILKDILMIFL